MTKSAFRRLEVITAICLFLTAVIIYLLWRDQQLLVHRLIHTCGLQPWLNDVRGDVASIDLPEWIRFALPDGLWSMSYILFIDALVRRDYLLTSVIPVIGLLSELMQLAGWLPGTFDVCDLVAYALPYLLYVLLLSSHQYFEQRNATCEKTNNTSK